MNEKRRRFAHEYVIDHNATRAAIRAGYAESRAMQTGHELVNSPEVAQLIAKLDAEAAERLGIDKDWVLQTILDKLEVAGSTQPKLWKGEPVTYTKDGEQKVAVEFVNGAAMTRLLEMLFKQAGFDVSRVEAEQEEQVVFQLNIDRDLGEED